MILIEDRVLVRMFDAEEQAIYLPEGTRSRLQGPRGVVVDFGPGQTSRRGIRMPIGVKVGDHVVLNRHPFYTPETVRPEHLTEEDRAKYGGDLLRNDNLLIWRERDVAGVLEESAS